MPPEQIFSILAIKYTTVILTLMIILLVLKFFPMYQMTLHRLYGKIFCYMLWMILRCWVAQWYYQVLCANKEEGYKIFYA